jgi:hypothetical protein
MFRRRQLLTFVLLLFTFGPVSLALAADHLDAPALRTAGQGGRDINDVYAFQSPANAANSVLIMTVNPFAGVTNPFGTVSPRTFDPAVQYEFQIDNNGDAVADVTYATTFTAAAGGIQTLTTTRNGAAFGTGNTGTNIAIAGGRTLRAGLFEDPFFFDLVGFNNNFMFTGADTFAGADISAIVLEVPSADLQAGANTNIGVWARTVVGGSQVDRMGRPAINTALIPSARKDEFNQAAPANDMTAFGADVQARIDALNGAAPPNHAPDTADLLLPDVLTFNTANASGFLNGRRLADDVIDAELNVLSNGGVTTDMVNSNDRAFRSVFPYMANPNFIPEPSTIALLAAALAAIGYGVRRPRDRA